MEIMASTPATIYEKGNLYQIPITDFKLDPAQPRKVVDPDEQLSGVIGKARQTVSDILTLNRLPLEIRDKCRGERTITRKTLIEIARKKQERAMITAYNAYMDKQNQVKGNRQKKDPNDPGTALEIAQKTVMKIDNIDTTAWTDEERESFRVTLVELRDKINSFLSPGPALA